MQEYGFQIRMDSGEWVTVEGEAVGQFAVHRQVIGGGGKWPLHYGRQWRVSHMPTGYGMSICADEKKYAVAAAKKFHELGFSAVTETEMHEAAEHFARLNGDLVVKYVKHRLNEAEHEGKTDAIDEIQWPPEAKAVFPCPSPSQLKWRKMTEEEIGVRPSWEKGGTWWRSQEVCYFSFPDVSGRIFQYRGWYNYLQGSPLEVVNFRTLASRLARPHRGFPFGPDRKWTKSSHGTVIDNRDGPGRQKAGAHYKRFRDYPGDYRAGQVGFDFLGE